MSKKKEDKKLTKDQAEKKIQTLKKDLFNIITHRDKRKKE